MNRIQKYYLFFLLCFACLMASAQEYVIQRLTVSDGLPSDRVNCVYEDSYGYLWVGSSNGLGRYDGRSFTNYGFAEGLPYLQISAIFEDSRQRLWIGTTKGIARLSGNRFTSYKIGSNNNDYTWTYGFYETDKKEICVLTNKGVYEFNGDSVWTHTDPYPQYKNQVCKGIVSDSSGLYFNYGSSIVKKDKSSNWLTVAQAPVANDLSYFNSVQNHDGKMYVSTANRLFSIEKNKLKLLVDDIPATEGYNYYIEDDRCFVTVPGRGLYVYGLPAVTPLYFTGYRSNFLFTIYRDKHGNMWMTSYEGLLKIQPKTFTDYQKEVFKEPLKEIRNIISLYNDLLISSSNSGFHILHDNVLKDIPAPSFYDNVNQYKHDMVQGYSDDFSNGTLMMTREKKFLYMKQGHMYDFSKGIHYKTNEPFYDIAVNPLNNKIFVCTDSSLLVGNNDKLEVYHDADGKTFDKPISVVMTWDGIGIVNVFFKGIYFITKENKIVKASSDLDIIDERVSGWIYPGLFDWMWVRNAGRGLLCFRVKDSLKVKDIRQFTTAEGLPSNDVLDIATDKEERLWVCTSNGLAVMTYNKAKDSWDIYNVGKQQGINFDSWVDGRMAVDTLGNIWLSTTDNLIKLYPSKIHLRKETPRAVIEKVMLGMNETEWDKRTDSVYSYFQLPYKPVFKYNENSLGIHFNGTNLSEHSALEYSYKLEPLDTAWSQATQNNFVSLLKLVPGNYVFNVRVKNEDTSWSEPASFSFTIERPFWDRWWFRLLLVGFAAFIILFFYRRRIKAIQEEASIQNQLNELEMKALKAQMNPHFIYNALNSIQSLIVDEKKSQAINYVGTFSRLLRQVLEHTDSNVINLEKELHTLKLYIQLESLRLNIDLNYTIDTDSEVMTEYEKVPPLVLQPFVENSLWHGLSRKEGEKMLKIVVTQTDQYLVVTITDNGIGRAKAATFKKSSASEMYASRGIDITIKRLIEFNKTKDPPVVYTDLTDENEQPIGTSVNVYIKRQGG
ncbi:MAG: two-component regulator propeller domain-containing protein [Chitinophagaceae bacterium]